jgi:hypothetical protein
MGQCTSESKKSKPVTAYQGQVNIENRVDGEVYEVRGAYYVYCSQCGGLLPKKSKLGGKKKSVCKHFKA